MSRESIVLCDIDGTIANCDHRVQRFLACSPKDWNAFHDAMSDDTPIEDVARLVWILASLYEIVYCTGRPDSHRTQTTKWLDEHGMPPAVRLLMRKAGDHRDDTVVKPDSVLSAGIHLADIRFVIEDRPKVCRKWRELGLTVLQLKHEEF